MVIAMITASCSGRSRGTTFAALGVDWEGGVPELVRRGELPARRFGRLVRIHRDGLRLIVPKPPVGRHRRRD